MVMGTLQVGTAATPYTHKAIITLNATNVDEQVMNMGTRGIMVMGGKLDLHGVPPTRHVTKLNDHAAAGATTLSLADAVSWSVSDQIVIATSDYYGAGTGSAQRTNITAINGTTSLNIQEGLNAYRWGKLQYLTATGMSLTPGTLPANLVTGTPTVLDERAEVANLTRNIVVQSVDDDLWRNNGFGCHIMVMRTNSMTGEARLNGVEIRRGGQAGRLGRYPFHWHMLSYSGSTTLPDVTGQYIRNSTVNQSAHRGIVIHGTNGTEVKNNVIYDVRGHGIFTEDASERRNIIDGNLVLKVRNPAVALKIHETDRERGSSGFWISNPDNTMINNTASDCAGNGFWLAFPRKTFGQSSQVSMRPNRLKFGTFRNNHAHSNQMEGINLDFSETDEAGNTSPDRYGSTTDGQEEQWPWNTVLTFELADYTTWKNNRNGIWNRSTAPLNRRVVNADNSDRFFAGSIDNKESSVPAMIENSLVVGTSLNYNKNGVTNPPEYGSGPLAAFASYHSSVDIINNVVVNFPADPGKPSGYMAMDDYYISPVDKGNVRNTGNILINTHPGVRTKPRLTQHVFGVIWDNLNYTKVATASQDNYYVYDEPFFTHGQTRQIVAPGAEVSGGVVIRGPFYGFGNYYVNGVERVYDKIAVTRTTAAGGFIGNWVVEAGAPGDLLGNMRHFAAHPTGYYYLDFPNIDNVNDFIMRVDNMLTTNDYQVVSVEYSGTYTISQLFASRAYNMDQFGGAVPFPTAEANTRAYSAVADFQAVVNAPNGEVYWQDRANNKVWFKVRGGLNPGDPALPATHDRNLLKSFRIRAYGTQTSTPPPPVTPPVTGGGSVVREVWSNVTGTAVAAIPVNTTPTSTSNLSSLEAPTNVADDYGVRIRGYITPATTGTYKFYIAADDNAEFWLNTSGTLTRRAFIEAPTGWTGSREWNKNTAMQHSADISLTAGTRYYFEILHKEGGGGDNLAVGWTGPGISAITVVPGSVLSPYTPETTSGFNGTYRITARHSNKSLDVTNSSTADGGNVQQWTANGTPAQQWIITATTDGHYRIVNKGSNKALEVAGNGTTDGANVQQWSYVGSNSQQWKIEATTDGFYRLLNRHSGKALDVAGVSTADGANIHQWAYVGGNNQQWKLEQLSTATARTALSSEQELTEGLHVYPNPATGGTVNLELGAKEAGKATVVLTNVLGQIESREFISVREGRNSFKISTRGLAGGLYMIIVEQGSRRTVRKLYVQ